VTFGYASISGRIIGPDGLGRAGSVEFIPLDQYVGSEDSGRQVLLAHYAVGRLNTNGYLVDHGEERRFRVVAPESLPEGDRNYRVVIDVPGAPGGRREYLAAIIAGTTVDLVDIVAGRRVDDHSSSRVRDMGPGILGAINPNDVVEVGDGLLAWKEGIND
jgi:hypothetical protein